MAIHRRRRRDSPAFLDPRAACALSPCFFLLGRLARKGGGEPKRPFARHLQILCVEPTNRASAPVARFFLPLFSALGHHPPTPPRIRAGFRPVLPRRRASLFRLHRSAPGSAPRRGTKQARWPPGRALPANGGAPQAIGGRSRFLGPASRSDPSLAAPCRRPKPRRLSTVGDGSSLLPPTPRERPFQLSPPKLRLRPKTRFAARRAGRARAWAAIRARRLAAREAARDRLGG